MTKNILFRLTLTGSFVKWAAVEVSQFEQIPEGMECFELPGGLYAVFFYKGSSTDNSIFKMIFNEWLPHRVMK
jgi:AraC family transcriptional regulator